MEFAARHRDDCTDEIACKIADDIEAMLAECPV